MSREAREAYIEKLDAKLREWSADIDRLKAKAEGSEVKVMKEIHKRIEELRARREDIKKRTQKLREAGDEGWEEIRAGTDKAWQEMKTSVEKAASKFREKTGRE